MPPMLSMFCVVLGLVLLLLQAFRIPTPENPRISLGWLGLFFVVLSTVVKW